MFQENGLLRLTVYRGEPEEYVTFASVEASEALREYLESRESSGEKLSPGSPLVRDKWNYDDLLRRKKRSPRDASEALPMTTKAVKNQLGFLWMKAGVRTLNEGGRHEFQQAHGFRKLFQTQASKAISNPQMVERLKGRKVNYFKPSLEEVEAAYLQAMPHLLLSEEYALKEQVERRETEYSARDAKTRLDLLETKQKVAEMEKVNDELQATLAQLQAGGQIMTKEQIADAFNRQFLLMSRVPESEVAMIGNLASKTPDELAWIVKTKAKK